ncbi:unnamed protein product, partial [marine sediment metagenome]
ILLKSDNETRSQVFFEIKRWVEDGRISTQELDDRVRRVLMMKAQQGLFENGGIVDPDMASEALRDPETVKSSRDVARKATMVLRDRQGLLPLSSGQKVMVIEQLIPPEFVPNDMHCHARSFNEAMLNQSLNLVNVDTEFRATPDERKLVMSLLKEVDVVVLTNYVFRIEPGNNSDLARAIARRNKPLIVVTNNPYPPGVPAEAGTVVCTFSATPESLRVAAALLYGKATSRASWPLTKVKMPGN